MAPLLKNGGSEDGRVGTTVADRYRIEALLGAGGMGTVYRARHISMQKTVALKILHREMTGVGDMVARFEREAVAAGRIDHANVAAATDFGRLADGSLYLVLEYVHGKSLSQVLEAGPLPVDRALLIARQVADALRAAHDAGIVHRDLKPDNVMLVEEEDGTDRVKVLDFGIAKMVSEGNASNQPLTRFGTVMGTVSYMSPEQAVGQSVDARTDLYSLGVMLFEMLAGHVPFQAAEMAQVLAKQITEPPPPLPATIPAEVGRLVFSLLEKTPRDRPESASQVVEEIRTLQGFPPSSRQLAVNAALPPVSFRSTLGSVGARDETVAALPVAPSTPTSWRSRRLLVLLAVASALGTVGGLVLAGSSSNAPAAQRSSVAPALSGASPEPGAGASAEPVSASVSSASTIPTPSISSSATAVSAPRGTASAEATNTTVTRTTSVNGSKTVRRTTTQKKTTKSRRTTKKKRRTGPGGIYIPPPIEWF